MRKLVLVFGLLLGLEFSIAAQDAPISRLPRVADHPSDPVLKQLFDETRARGAEPLNIQLTIGNAPKIAKATQTLAYALRFEATTPRPLRELVILRTTQIVGSDYELAQHKPIVLACGYTQAQVDAVANWKASSLFNDKDRATLAYVEEVARGGDVDDATFAALQRFFSPEQIVELTVLIGNYYSSGLLAKAFKIQIEHDGRVFAGAKCI